MSAAGRYLSEIFGDDADLSEMRAMSPGEGDDERGDEGDPPPGDDRPATNERPRDERGRFVRAEEPDQAEDDGDDEDARDQADGEQDEDDEGERTPAAGCGEPLSAADSPRPRRLTPVRPR